MENYNNKIDLSNQIVAEINLEIKRLRNLLDFANISSEERAETIRKIEELQKVRTREFGKLSYYRKLAKTDKVPVRGDVQRWFGKVRSKLTKEELAEYNRIKKRESRDRFISEYNCYQMRDIIDCMSKERTDVKIFTKKELHSIIIGVVEHLNDDYPITALETMTTDNCGNLRFRNLKFHVKQLLNVSLNGEQIDYKDMVTYIHTKFANTKLEVKYYYYAKYTPSAVRANKKISQETIAYGCLAELCKRLQLYKESVDFAKKFVAGCNQNLSLGE